MTLWLFSILLLIACRKNESEIAIVGNRDGMLLREKPNAKEAKLAYAPYNSSVKIIDKGGPEETIYGLKARWYKVEYEGKTGWMFSAFLHSKNNSAGASIDPKKMQAKTRREAAEKKRETPGALEGDDVKEDLFAPEKSGERHCSNKGYEKEFLNLIRVSSFGSQCQPGSLLICDVTKKNVHCDVEMNEIHFMCVPMQGGRTYGGPVYMGGGYFENSKGQIGLSAPPCGR